MIRMRCWGILDFTIRSPRIELVIMYVVPSTAKTIYLAPGPVRTSEPIRKKDN